MNLYCYLSNNYQSNIYILVSRKSRKAVIVDPVCFDEGLFQLIENNGYNLTGVLFTRIDEKRIHGIRTLLRIYDAEVIASGLKSIQGNIHDPGDAANGSIAGLDYRIMGVEHYKFFKIGPYVFTGNGFSSGRALTESVRQVIFSLDNDCIILPGSGPPTTVAAEREWNPRMQEGQLSTVG